MHQPYGRLEEVCVVMDGCFIFVYLPYGGNLSQVKTFVNFTVSGATRESFNLKNFYWVWWRYYQWTYHWRFPPPFTKVLIAKIWFSAVCESFRPRKIPAIHGTLHLIVETRPFASSSIHNSATSIPSSTDYIYTPCVVPWDWWTYSRSTCVYVWLYSK